VGSSKAIIELLNQLRIKTTMTSKLVGVSEGKRLYRTTFLIRL
jgi:NMD protein affecting ribosome stability and mRNA decay